MKEADEKYPPETYTALEIKVELSNFIHYSLRKFCAQDYVWLHV